MTIDKTKLKALAEAARDYSGGEVTVHEGHLDALACASDPDTILALLDEIDGLHAQHGRDSAELRRLCSMRDLARKQCDQLKAENAQLKNQEIELRSRIEQAKADGAEVWGLAQGRADDIDRLKAESEALRKSLDECATSLEGEMLQKFAGQKPEDMHPVTRREYDRDMAELAGYRAAMAKEASHG